MKEFNSFTIGIVGNGGSGKNTVAGLMAGYLCNFGYMCVIDDFSSPFKMSMRTGMGWEGEKDEYWRWYMQTRGEGECSYNKEHWVDAFRCRHFRRNAPQYDFYIIPRCQKQVEADFIRRNGLLVWLDSTLSNIQNFTQKQHVTEDVKITKDIKTDIYLSIGNNFADMLSGVHEIADTIIKRRRS